MADPSDFGKIHFADGSVIELIAKDAELQMRWKDWRREAAMTLQDLQEAARRQPFQPFRLILTTGETRDIRHPDLIMVGHRSLIIGIPSPAAPTVYDRTIKVDNFHVVGIEELPAPNGTPPGNPS
jgi:hypothetical protein